MAQEWAVRNPRNGEVMTVPGGTEENARLMAGYVQGSVVLTRTVTDWEPETAE